MQEPIIKYVKRRLREIGPPEWGAVSAGAHVEVSTPRKLAYERKDVKGETLEAFYRYFLRRDYGLKKLPHENGPITKA